MQGLVNFATAIADGIAVLLPAFCYLMASGCFFFFAWTLWTWSDSHSRYSHPHGHRPWVPFVSLILCGVFATFPKFLTMANVSAGTNMTVDLTQYAATTPPSASSLLGDTPNASIINVVTMFQYFFEAFGGACVAWAIVRWRGIINGTIQGSPTSCAIQFVFGILCINVLTIANGIQQFFNTTSS
jgi:hypothetical protein